MALIVFTTSISTASALKRALKEASLSDSISNQIPEEVNSQYLPYIEALIASNDEKCVEFCTADAASMSKNEIIDLIVSVKSSFHKQPEARGFNTLAFSAAILLEEGAYATFYLSASPANKSTIQGLGTDKLLAERGEAISNAHNNVDYPDFARHLAILLAS